MEPEEKLINPKQTALVLQRHGFHFSKRFGQNFLIDSHVMEKIMDGAMISRQDCVLEIGPGIGTMTQFLAERAGQVVAVEIDDKLIPILSETLAGFDNVTVINDDILKTDIAAIAEKYGRGRLKVVANLPYYVTTPIIMGLLEQKIPFTSITVMVQKEVARRMAAGPGTSDFGALSLAVQYYCEPYIVANVPPHCFMPRPNVDSAVIRLTRHEQPPVRTADEGLMFALVKAAFAQRRKMMANAISKSPELSFAREQITDALTRLGIDENIRGEKLSLQQFAALADELSRSAEGNT